MKLTLQIPIEVEKAQAIKMLKEAGYEFYPNHEFYSIQKRHHNQLCEVLESEEEAFEVHGQILQVEKAFLKVFSAGLKDMINYHLNNV